MSSSGTGLVERAGPAPRAWIITGAIWLAFVLNYVDRQVAFSIFPVLRSDLGFSNASLGLIGSIFIWIYSVCSPVAGRVADAARCEYLLVASLALWSLATLGTSFSGSPLQFLFWRGVMGVTEALFVPAALTSLGRLHPGRTRSRALAFYSTGQMTGIVAGGWYGGWMATNWGWRNGFIALGLAGIAFAPLFRALLGDIPAPAKAAREQAGRGGLPRSHCYWALAGAFFMLCVLLWVLYAWLPDWLYERYSLPLDRAGLTATAYLQTGTILGLAAGGWLGDRIAAKITPARFYIVGTGLLAGAPFAWLAFSGAPLGLLKLSAASFGLFSGFAISNVVASAYDVIPQRMYGIGGGLLNMIGGLSGGMAMFLAGRLKDTLGPGGLMMWSSVAAAVSAAGLLAVAAKRFGKERI